MNRYTIQIEAEGADGTRWQALHPSEEIASTGTARDVAEIVAENQNIVNDGRWRVLVWDDPDGAHSTDPVYTLERP